MEEEQLVVEIKRIYKYNSYQGEVFSVVDNLIIILKTMEMKQTVFIMMHITLKVAVIT